MNRSNLSKILVFVFSVAFIVTLLYSSYYLFPSFADFVDTNVPWVGRSLSGRSSFGSLVGKGEVVELDHAPLGAEWTPAVDVFYKFLQDSEAYSENNTAVPYWQNWNWQTSLFWANVLWVDEVQETVSLEFGEPSTLGSRENITVRCTPENSVSFVHEDLTLLHTKFDVFGEISAGDILYSQCLDEACASVGKYCFIIKKYDPR